MARRTSAYAPGNFDPPMGIRIAWWFGIYFGAQLPLMMYALGFYLFPAGLIALFVSFTENTIKSSQTWPNSPSYLDAIPYIFYTGHCLVSLLIRSRKAFRILMIVLTIVVVLNLAGCEVMIYQVRNSD